MKAHPDSLNDGVVFYRKLDQHGTLGSLMDDYRAHATAAGHSSDSAREPARRHRFRRAEGGPASMGSAIRRTFCASSGVSCMLRETIPKSLVSARSRISSSIAGGISGREVMGNW